MATSSAKTNRLIQSQSPYLLQHADNPVNWYPWGQEAFETARKADKPILLSSGYSTCHWCHVMAEQSFTDPGIAEIMNRSFVCIKLDREERPDIDHIYISAVSALTGSAGWPLNVFLTPQGKPFYGGTYYPPDPRPGQPAWRQVLMKIEATWQDPAQRQKIETTADSVTELLQTNFTQTASAPDNGQIDINKMVKSGLAAFERQFDDIHGGLKGAPKFPMPPVLAFWVALANLEQNGLIGAQNAPTARTMVTRTLSTMAGGGIYDQIGGGFHRYATDEKWFLPHFEKMLYDNAQLVNVYLAAQDVIDDPRLAKVASETLDYLQRDLEHPEGGFYSAEDADSRIGPDQAEKREGAFYVWSVSQLEKLLAPGDLSLCCYHFGLRPEGNVAVDPFGDFKGKNVLWGSHSLAETAAAFDLFPEETAQQLEKIRSVLLTARQSRPRPHLDDKILTAWNGLAISAFANGYRWLGQDRYLIAATKAAEFIQAQLWDAENLLLYRRWRNQEKDIPGLAEDYAFLIQGLLDLYQAGLEQKYLIWADSLAHLFYRRFFDPAQGACYTMAADHDPLAIVRAQETQDNVLPSALSVGVMIFLRLATLTGTPEYTNAVQRIFSAQQHGLAKHPTLAPLLLKALIWSLSGPIRLVILGQRHDPETVAMIRAARNQAWPPLEILLIDSVDTQQAWQQKLPEIGSFQVPETGAQAQACQAQTCYQPVHTAQDLTRLLQSLGNRP